MWDKWVPFTVQEADELQLEFSMLSPFHRLNLQRSTESSLSSAAAQDKDSAATYTVSFRLPDQHGIFNFKVNYKRPFLSNIEEKNTVSVRQLAHDEWPRSFVITAAWPWVAGLGATIAGWLGFCAIWLYSKPAEASTKKTQ